MHQTEGADDVPPGPGGEPVQAPSEKGATSGLLSSTASMVGFRILSSGAAGMVGVITARRLEPAGRGVLVLLVAMASIGLLFSSFGVNISGRVHLVKAVDPVQSRDYIGLSAALALVQVLMCVALGVTLLPAADVRLSVSGLAVFGVLGAAMLGQYLLNDALNAYGLTTLATKVEAAASVVQLLLVLMLAAAGERSVMPFVGTLAVSSFFHATLALAMLRRAGIAIRPRFKASSWRLLLRSGLPGIPAALGQVLTFRADRYLLGLFMNPAAVGVYSVAATAPELLRLPSLALSQPMLYRLASGSAKIDDFRRIRRLCVIGTMAAAAAVFAFAPLAVRVVFGPDYAAAVTPLRVLLLGEAGIALFYLDGSALAGINRIRDAALASVTGLVVVGILDLVLIPSFQLAGAAWASVVAYSLMGAVAAALLHRAQRAASP